MNRRDFLKVVTATTAVMAVPSLIPADARLVLDANNEKVIGNITRTIEWHSDSSAHFITYHGKINNIDYYRGDFVDEADEETLRTCDLNALQAFKRRATLQSKIDLWKSTHKAERIALLKAGKMG